jgi:hypothetical protein
MLRFFILTNIVITAVSSFTATHSFRITAPSVITTSFGCCHNFASPKRRRNTCHIIYSTSRDEEIAKLEAQLRQLRESESIPANDEDNVAAAATKATTLDPDDVRTLKEFAEARRRLEKVKGKDMLLTEQELIKGGLMDDSSNSNFGGPVPAIAVAIAALVGLIAFAQIPIGQEDLARYSATGSSTLKTIDLGDLNPDVSRR